MQLSFLRAMAIAVMVGLALVISGCASSTNIPLIDKSLELVGLKKPEIPITQADLPPVDQKVTLRIHGADLMNTDPSARSLSAVVRIYRLREANAFLNAPPEAFKDPASERAAFGNDLADVKEIVLRPGQKYETVETLPLTVSYVAVATLFRAPAEGRWRFAFSTKDATKTGITLGVHGCAMSVAAGHPVGTPPELLRLAGVQCL